MIAAMLLHNGYAEESKPSQLVTRFDFYGLTDKEQELYVSGVLDGVVALFHLTFPEANEDDLQKIKALERCIKSEGVKTIKNVAQSLMVVHVEDRKNPLPWTISKVLVTMCEKYKEKPK